MRRACVQHVWVPTMLQVRNVPDGVHDELRRRARAAGMSLSAERLDAVLHVGDGPLSRAPGLRCSVEVLSD